MTTQIPNALKIKNFVFGMRIFLLILKELKKLLMA